MMNFYTIFFLLVLFSCGKSVNDKTDKKSGEEIRPDGIYSAVLIPVNYRLSTQVHGEVKIVKFGDDFSVEVKVKGAPRGSLRQHLQTGSSCPRLNQDENGDGYIDFYESLPVSGKILVPLDGDLSAQDLGQNLSLRGNYSYSRSTSYDLMLSDLHLRDEIINDAIIKLRERELILEKKVIVLYASGIALPESIKGTEIPVACGILTRVSNRTETEEDEWNRTPSPPDVPERPRPRTSPRPRPDNDPAPLPLPEEERDRTNEGWWSRWRSRWEEWRGRMGDWWNGRDDER